MLQKVVDDFLKVHWDRKGTLLLGYSGGPDSKALLYALKKGQVAIEVAHVDHGWRPESRNEALLLQKEVEELGYPFHSIRLSPPSEGNRESIAREERFAFFVSLWKKGGMAALLLAHQKDDLVETVLKRVFEGAHLPFLGGMEPVGNREEMPLWRPLLSLSKQQIFSYLQEKGLEPLLDPTNGDPKYLRARMRLETVPFLTHSFGKKIFENLLLLSERAAELRSYLDRKVRHRIAERGPWGLFGFLADLERIEARYLVQKWAKEEGMSLSRPLLERILNEIYSKRTHRWLSSQIFVDRGILFLIRKDLVRKENSC